MAPANEADQPAKPAKKKNTKGCLATVAIILGVLAILTVAVEYMVTYRTEGLAASQVDAILQPEQASTVGISMHPILLKLFLGRVDEMTVEAQGFKMQYGLEVQQARLDVKGLKVDFWALLKTRQISAVKSIDSGSARIVLSEEAINALIETRMPGAVVKLDRDRFRYHDDLTALVAGAVIDVPGRITVLPGNTLRLEPLPGEIEKLALPQDVKDYLTGSFTVDYKLYDIPDSIELTKVTLRPGQAVLDAKITSLDFITTGVNGG